MFARCRPSPFRGSDATSADLVIVGASLAGLRTAEAARKLGFAGSSRIIGQGPHLPYIRPTVSKLVLTSNMSATDLAFPIRSLLDDVEWMLSTTIVGADLDSATVVTTQGRRIGYGTLVIAIGRRARRLLSTHALDRRHVVHTIEDAERLRSSVTSRDRVAIVGGGFIASRQPPH